jgi:hypothetical protein
MNYYAARQRKDGKWDYTCSNDGDIWPVGYCNTGILSKGPETEPEGSFYRMSEIEWKSICDNKEKYHDHGHKTAEEACKCYKNYLLDNALRFHRPTEEQKQKMDTQHKCKICSDWTQNMAELDLQHWYLCEKHLNRETVEKLFGNIGESWSS